MGAGALLPILGMGASSLFPGAALGAGALGAGALGPAALGGAATGALGGLGAGAGALAAGAPFGAMGTLSGVGGLGAGLGGLGALSAAEPLMAMMNAGAPGAIPGLGGSAASTAGGGSGMFGGLFDSLTEMGFSPQDAMQMGVDMMGSGEEQQQMQPPVGAPMPISPVAPVGSLADASATPGAIPLDSVPNMRGMLGGGFGTFGNPPASERAFRRTSISRPQ